MIARSTHTRTLRRESRCPVMSTSDEGAHIGTGASIIQGIEVGDASIVGAGAVVSAMCRRELRSLVFRLDQWQGRWLRDSRESHDKEIQFTSCIASTPKDRCTSRSR